MKSVGGFNMIIQSIVVSLMASIFTWAVYRSAYKAGFKHGITIGRYDGYPIDGNESK